MFAQLGTRQTKKVSNKLRKKRNGRRPNGTYHDRFYSPSKPLTYNQGLSSTCAPKRSLQHMLPTKSFLSLKERRRSTYSPTFCIICINVHRSTSKRPTRTASAYGKTSDPPVNSSSLTRTDGKVPNRVWCVGQPSSRVWFPRVLRAKPVYLLSAKEKRACTSVSRMGWPTKPSKWAILLFISPFFQALMFALERQRHHCRRRWWAYYRYQFLQEIEG